MLQYNIFPFSLKWWYFWCHSSSYSMVNMWTFEFWGYWCIIAFVRGWQFVLWKVTFFKYAFLENRKYALIKFVLGISLLAWYVNESWDIISSMKLINLLYVERCTHSYYYHIGGTSKCFSKPFIVLLRKLWPYSGSLTKFSMKALRHRTGSTEFWKAESKIVICSNALEIKILCICYAFIFLCQERRDTHIWQSHLL
jgi:hypothetical protein